MRKIGTPLYLDKCEIGTFHDDGFEILLKMRVRLFDLSYLCWLQEVGDTQMRRPVVLAHQNIHAALPKTN